MSYEEQGIFQAQAAAAKAQSAQRDGLQKHNKWSIANLDERFMFFAFMMAVFVLVVVWLTAKSPLIFYSSLALVLLLVVLWGVVRIVRVLKIEEQRGLQVEAMRSEDSENH